MRRTRLRRDGRLRKAELGETRTGADHRWSSLDSRHGRPAALGFRGGGPFHGICGVSVLPISAALGEQMRATNTRTPRRSWPRRRHWRNLRGGPDDGRNRHPSARRNRRVHLSGSLCGPLRRCPKRGASGPARSADSLFWAADASTTPSPWRPSSELASASNPGRCLLRPWALTRSVRDAVYRQSSSTPNRARDLRTIDPGEQLSRSVTGSYSEPGSFEVRRSFGWSSRIP